MKCQCSNPGWCETHKRTMLGRLHQLCSCSDTYFDVFAIPVEATPEQASNQRKFQSQQVARYHAHWSELHTKQDPTQQWFDDWVKRIPRYGCNCEQNLRPLLKESPIEFGDGFFASTVCLHNAVNRKLGKPEMTVEDARKIHFP